MVLHLAVTKESTRLQGRGPAHRLQRNVFHLQPAQGVFFAFLGERGCKCEWGMGNDDGDANMNMGRFTLIETRDKSRSEQHIPVGMAIPAGMAQIGTVHR